MSERLPPQHHDALGFTAEIPQAFWRRVTRYQMPVKWFAAWLGLAMAQALAALTSVPGPRSVTLTAAGSLIVGELLLLQWLTRADPYWDSLVTQRDCHYYEAE